MGKIIISERTCKDPITLIGEQAGICWKKDPSDKEKNYKRGLNCINSNHGRTFEFPDVYAYISGYSARVLREWYTHIGGDPTRLQESTRYIDYSNFEYITPESILKNEKAKELYDACEHNISETITQLKALGIPNEDATMLLSMSYQSSMVDKRNARNIIDISRVRLCKRANWEFRAMFVEYLKQLSNYSEEWKTFIKLTCHPKCVEYGYCNEEKSCGLYISKKEFKKKNNM